MSKILSIFTPAIGIVMWGFPYSIVWCAFFSFRNGVIAAFSEGIAAQDTPQCEKRADNDSPFLHCADGISGAGGAEAAGSLWLEWGEKPSVEPDRKQVQGFQTAVSLLDE